MSSMSDIAAQPVPIICFISISIEGLTFVVGEFALKDVIYKKQQEMSQDTRSGYIA
jgi:hypothetical protein